MCIRSPKSKTARQNSRTFLYMLSVAVARSSFDNNAIHYVLPFLWKTSCFHIMEQVVQTSRMFHPVCQVAAPGGEVCLLFGFADGNWTCAGR